MVKIRESSWSRIIQHIEGPKPFAVISAYQRNNTKEENTKLHYELEHDITNLGYGYIEMDSGYLYAETGETKKEKSFFIPSISLIRAIQLGIKYKQESILYKDNSGFKLIYTTAENGFHVGQIATTFDMKRKPNGQITFDADTLKLAFSKLIKGSKNQVSKKFAYVPECVSIEEGHPPSWGECMGSKTMLSVRWYQIA